jgi:hypothetical protein
MRGQKTALFWRGQLPVSFQRPSISTPDDDPRKVAEKGRAPATPAVVPDVDNAAVPVATTSAGAVPKGRGRWKGKEKMNAKSTLRPAPAIALTPPIPTNTNPSEPNAVPGTGGSIFTNVPNLDPVEPGMLPLAAAGASSALNDTPTTSLSTLIHRSHSPTASTADYEIGATAASSSLASGLSSTSQADTYTELPSSEADTPSSSTYRNTDGNTDGHAQATDVERMLQNARSIASMSGSQTDALQRKLEELGPTQEVLEALQAILRRNNEQGEDLDLPRYEEPEAEL